MSTISSSSASMHGLPGWMSAPDVPAPSDDGAGARESAEALSADEAEEEADEAPELVLRAIDGDAAAFGELIDRHERAALAVAYAATRDAALAADAVQEACLKAWYKRQTLADPRRFAGWLLHIVRRSAIDQMRRTRPVQPLGLIEEPAAPAGETGTDAAGGLIRRETDQRVREALEELDEESRLAVVMRYYDDAPARRIAEVLGCSPAAVDMRLKRARDKLRARLADLGHDGMTTTTTA